MFFDIVFALYIAASAFLGFRYGLFRRFLSLGAFFLGMLLSQALSPGFAESFGYNTGAHPADGHFAVYLALIVGLLIVAEVLGFAYADALGFMNAMIADRFLGLALGAAAAVAQITVLLYLFAQLVSVNLPTGGSHASLTTSSQDQVGTSLIARQVHKIQQPVLFFFRPVLPPEPQSYFAKTYT